MNLDKLLHTKWFVQILAFALALMLYAGVNMDSPTNTGASSFMTNGPQDYEAIPNVELKAYYDLEQYAVSNLPADVTVYLEGPSSTLTTTKMQDSYEVYVDLNNLTPGEHQVRVQHKGFSKSLNVKIEPAFLTVKIQEKVTQAKGVQIDYLNRDKIAEGYTAEAPIVLPNNIMVTGAKDTVAQVGIIKGFVDLKGASQTVEKSIPLKVYDQNGEPLQVELNPSVVEVKVPIIAPNKTIPVIISRKGKLGEGLSVNSFETTPNEVTIFGPEEVIKDIEYIDDLSIDLSSIKEDTIKEVELPVPNGVKKVSPSTIKVKIDVEPEETKKITNLPVKVIGLSDAMELAFKTPSLGSVDLHVYGTDSVLENITRSDFHVVLNLSEYSEGEHKVTLEVFGPQDVRWELNTKKAVITITRKS